MTAIAVVYAISMSALAVLLFRMFVENTRLSIKEAEKRVGMAPILDDSEH